MPTIKTWKERGYGPYQETALSNLDSYKLGHPDQYPPGITVVYNNFTPRSDKLFNVPLEYKDGKVVWAGFQEFLFHMVDLWDRTFFSQPKEVVVAEFAELVAPFCGPNGYDTSRIEALHDLGFLPLEIKIIPEGSVTDIGVPVMTIANTRPNFFWLPNSIETWVSTELWKAVTSATMARVYSRILNKYTALTVDVPALKPWQAHDFSVRGMSGIRDAARSGFGHLLSSLGTDNVPAVKLARDAYNGKFTFVGGSVPATEHAVMCAGGEDSELETFSRLLDTYPSGVVSIVSDTWDFWNVITNIAAQLKDKIMNRIPDQFGLAKVVFRPDSGDPVKIICGYRIKEVEAMEPSTTFTFRDFEVAKFPDGKYFKVWDSTKTEDGYELEEISEAEAEGAVRTLAKIFGVDKNSAGFKTLNQRVGLIYGDSITPARAEEILSKLMYMGFAADNVVFGVGSFTYQYATRDTLGFAVKSTYVVRDGEGRAIFKEPVTDSGTKVSARGLLRVEKEKDPLSTTGFKYVLYQNQTPEEEKKGELKTAFIDGDIPFVESIDTIRQRASETLTLIQA